MRFSIERHDTGVTHSGTMGEAAAIKFLQPARGLTKNSVGDEKDFIKINADYLFNLEIIISPDPIWKC